MSGMVIPFRRDPMVKRLPKDNDSLRHALEDALKRLEKLEEEIARPKGKLPPEDDDT